MKKKPENKTLIEPCYRMNQTKTGILENKLSIKEDLDNGEKSLISPHTDVLAKVKSEQEPLGNNNSLHLNDHGKAEGRASPVVNLGPGAEIKGKLCHPIPSVSKVELSPSSPSDQAASPPPPGTCGGILTFFQEGRPLLELSHRSDHRSWIQVKSKTYWPPPSTTTATTTQHPLRHDTPTTHSASDDCSSLNSSPWSSDHVRKQISPRTKVVIPSELLFCIRASSFTRILRKKVRLRRNPHILIIGPLKNSDALNSSKLTKVNSKVKVNVSKVSLGNKIRDLAERSGLKLESSVGIRSLFEKSGSNHSEVTDPTFLSPRKRYLKNLETEHDSHIRKKVHSSLSASHMKNCDRPSSSSPSLHSSHKSAISSQNSSAYSIASLLNSENDPKKNDSFLRTLLKHEPKPRLSHSKARERALDHNDHIKTEKESIPPHSRDRKDPATEHRKPLPDHFELNHELPRYSSSPGIGGIYLNPYFDPRYMMLHGLSAGAPLLPPVSQPNDVSSTAVAVAAAAAAASYPINPYLSALTASSLIPPGLPSSYVSNNSLASHLLQSPSPNRSSPIPLPNSPISKPPIVPSPTAMSPHLRILGSPQDRSWGALVNSPNKITHEPPDSPPPQDVPLNLSKPKEKS